MDDRQFRRTAVDPDTNTLDDNPLWSREYIDEQSETICEMLNQGLNVSQIASALDVSRRAVWSVATHNGYSIVQPAPKSTKDHDRKRKKQRKQQRKARKTTRQRN